jgi:hypothetical protein
MHPITGLPFSMNGGLITDEDLAEQARDLITEYRNRQTPEHLTNETARELVLMPLRRAEAERVGRNRATDFVRRKIDALPMRKPVPASVLTEGIPDGLDRMRVIDAINAQAGKAAAIVFDGFGSGRTVERVRS